MKILIQGKIPEVPDKLHYFRCSKCGTIWSMLTSELKLPRPITSPNDLARRATYECPTCKAEASQIPEIAIAHLLNRNKCDYCICKTCAIAYVNGGAKGGGDCEKCKAENLTETKTCYSYYNPDKIDKKEMM